MKNQEKTKIPKFQTKSALFGFLRAGILKNFCHIWNQRPQICKFAKFGEEVKMLKFWTKSGLLGHVCARISEKLLSYLKITPTNLSTCKILRKNKNA